MLPLTVFHYSREDPRSTVGGVQRFARNLEKIFAEVRYLTPRSPDLRAAQEARLPIICDNQLVRDWPSGHPVIGFQHGVAQVKFEATRTLGHWLLARRQRRAASRPNTFWVACAKWVGWSFQRLYGNGASHVIYYPVDTERFDGRLQNEGSRLILHDARTRNKGKHLIARIQAAFPDWHFEPLGCPPEQVPERMRGARGFVHLSRYEGNSLVCGEAMAMDLPCMFTRVGLFKDKGGPEEVWRTDPRLLDGDLEPLKREVACFLETLENYVYNPRAWVLANATLATAESAWRRVMLDFQSRSGWPLGLAQDPASDRG